LVCRVHGERAGRDRATQIKAFDAIIIGTGQAGPSLAGRFSDVGVTVTIIECHKFGGTCLNTGCMHTKTMVASAYAAHVARRGDDYGFLAGDVLVGMKRVKARKDGVSGRSNKGVEAWLRGLTNCNAAGALWHDRPRNTEVRTTCAPYEIPDDRVNRAYEKGVTQGFIKVCVDTETKQILGAAIFGVGGDEVIHVLLDVMDAKAPYTVIQRVMHIHPTVAEYLPTVLAKLEPMA